MAAEGGASLKLSAAHTNTHTHRWRSHPLPDARQPAAGTRFKRGSSACALINPWLWSAPPPPPPLAVASLGFHLSQRSLAS